MGEGAGMQDEELFFRGADGKRHRKNAANFAKYGEGGGEQKVRRLAVSFGHNTVAGVQARNYVFADGSSAHFFSQVDA